MDIDSRYIDINENYHHDKHDFSVLAELHHMLF